ncbi:MAG TPA: hypothetical protein VF681_11070 [Abditibacteriaceae bacterium]
MKKGSFTQHPLFGFFIGIGLVVLYTTFENAISPAMYNIFGTSWSWMKPLLFWILFGWAMKGLIWKALPQSLRIEPMNPADFAGVSENAAIRAALSPSPIPEVAGAANAKGETFSLNFAQLDARSHELEALGFVLQVEGVAQTDKKNAVPTFARIFRHAEGSWAELFQAFPRGMAPTPLTMAFLTYFEDSWLCGDSTMKRNWVLWMIRRPRSIGKLHTPETPALEIWSSHRERCAKLHQKIGVRVLPLDLDGYFGKAVESLKEGRRLMLRRSILVSMLQSQFTRRDGEDWKEVDKYAKSGAKAPNAA